MHFYGDTSNLLTPYDQFPMHQDAGDAVSQGFAPPGYLDMSSLAGIHLYDHMAINRRYAQPIPLAGEFDAKLSAEQSAYIEGRGERPGGGLLGGLGVAANQIPRWAWLTGGLGLVAAGGYLAYKRRKKAP